MDIMSLIGLFGAVGLLFFGMTAGGAQINSFHDIGSVAITVGGTFAALMLTFPMRTFAELPKMILKIFLPGKTFSPQKYAAAIVEIAIDERKNGILFLERKLSEYKDVFLRKGVQFIVDDEKPEEIREKMGAEIKYMAERHKQGVRFFEKGATLAPGFGILGTLTGLINMLAQAETPDGIMSGMAAALITTFYGLILANLIFIPMGNKLQKRSDEEILCKQMIIEGVIAVVNGESPKQISEKLEAYVPFSKRKNV